MFNLRVSPHQITKEEYILINTSKVLQTRRTLYKLLSRTSRLQNLLECSEKITYSTNAKVVTNVASIMAKIVAPCLQMPCSQRNQEKQSQNTKEIKSTHLFSSYQENQVKESPQLSQPATQLPTLNFPPINQVSSLKILISDCHAYIDNSKQSVTYQDELNNMPPLNKLPNIITPNNPPKFALAISTKSTIQESAPTPTSLIRDNFFHTTDYTMNYSLDLGTEYVTTEALTIATETIVQNKSARRQCTVPKKRNQGLRQSLASRP